MSYQIAWLNLKTGATGVGPKKWEDLNEIEALVDEMNAEFPDFEHRSVADGEPPQFEHHAPVPAVPFVVMTDTSLMPFGIHKDKPLLNVPSSYLDYILGQPWIGRWPALKDYIERNRKAIQQDLERRGI